MKNEGKHKSKNTMRTAQKTDLFFFKEKTSAQLSLTALLVAFWKSTCETIVALVNPFTLLPVATQKTFRCKYAFLTDTYASPWLFSSVTHDTTLLK